MNRLGARWRYSGLGALIVVCLGLLVIAASNIIRIERQMQISATQNMTWIFGQTQIEALSLSAALSNDANSDVVLLRYDLLVSRLNLLRDGPQWRFLSEAGLAEGLMGWRDGLLRLDPAEGGDPAALKAHVSALSMALRQKASQVMSREWQVRSERLDQLSKLHLLALAAIIGALISGAALAVLLVDRERRLMQARLDRLRAERLQRDLTHERAASEGYRRFADLIAHQVRTPLAVIDSAMHRLTRSGKPPAPEVIRTKADVSRQAVARLVRLTDTALMMARVDRGAVAPELACHDLDRIAATVIEDLHAGNRVTLRTGNHPVTAICDPVLTSEILSNLLSNALLYSPRHSEIDVRPLQNGELAICDVCDQGAGMTPEEMAAAFENFVRGARHRDLPGSGLGLPLARHLARLQGGDLMLKPLEGGGLTARLSLPAKVVT